MLIPPYIIGNKISTKSYVISLILAILSPHY